MGKFKSRLVFNEEPASKENHRMAGAQRARAYQSDFRREKCWQSGLLEDTEKRSLPQFTVMKKFSKFWFQPDGIKAHTADLTLDLVETHFKKRVILNHFPLKKRGLELAAIQPDLSPLDYFLWGYVRDQCYANRLSMISALRKNIIFLTRFEWIRAFSGWLPGTSGGVWRELWRGRVHRKCYILSCLTRVLSLNFVHSMIFKNFFRRERLFWKPLYNVKPLMTERKNALIWTAYLKKFLIRIILDQIFSCSNYSGSNFFLFFILYRYENFNFFLHFTN